MEVLEVMKSGRATEKSDCIICEKEIAVGSPQIYVEIKIGASFMKALQKTVRKSACIPCAKLIHECLGVRIDAVRLL